MGRKAKYEEKVKSGPGRKAKKQKPPQIPTHLQERDPTFISRRAKKRLNKQTKQNVANEGNLTKQLSASLESIDDNLISGDEQSHEEAETTKVVKKQKLFSDDEEDDDQASDALDDDVMGDDFEADGSDSDDDSEGDDDDMLPIEKASKKLMKKEKQLNKLNEAELQTNIQQTEIFRLPSGQEIEKENILFCLLLF
ncbi:hypothetical protein AVEN_256240-1 [Araneus ventricosus]|uniref:Uncharacterized protein n=1 Tax=Araneus ventricosus TaxID=182803 RepID=A0A4Y2INA9_ARAVE|nr:hypothetical protein AVEN_256240-1 [Araneus ventricosus]